MNKDNDFGCYIVVGVLANKRLTEQMRKCIQRMKIIADTHHSDLISQKPGVVDRFHHSFTVKGWLCSLACSDFCLLRMTCLSFLRCFGRSVRGRNRYTIRSVLAT